MNDHHPDRPIADVLLPVEPPPEVKRHRREAEHIDGRPVCFTCGISAAGNPTWPSSAYCEADQPRDDHPIIGGAFGCPVVTCLVQTGTLGLFDRHQSVDYSRDNPVECLDPGTFGDLTRDENGTFQTRAGLVKRARDGERLRAAREAHRPL
jgi:hypothetical protein